MDMASTQLSIDFSARTHCRAMDPITSRDAAARVREFASGQCAEILNLLITYGPMTPEQIADRLGITQVQACRRLPDLQKAGKAAPNGETAPTASGRSQRIWEAL